MTRVISIGECMLELRQREDGAYTRAFAGDAFNMAAYLKRSAPELEVEFLTVTGRDALSAAMRASWRSEGVGDALAFETPNATVGLYMIDVDRAGERSFSYWRSASAARLWFETLIANRGAENLDGADLIYLSGISLAILPDGQRAPALNLIEAARSQGARIAFDPNYRALLWESKARARECICAAMQVADFILPSTDDLSALDLTPPSSECVITNGALGCAVRTPTLNIELSTPMLAMDAVKDTSGAGDAFTGAYLAARLRGGEPEPAARAALQLAARVVTAPGALISRHISHPQASHE